jgi:hypothetical protein
VCATTNLRNRKDKCPNTQNSLAGMGTTWDVFCLKEHTGLFFKKKEKRSGK